MTPQQRKAALLVARGATCEDAGRAVGVSKRTVIRWAKTGEWQAELARLRGETPPTVVSADAVLAAALGATKAGGAPDWPARLRAAQLIKSFPPEPSPAESAGVITVYVERPEDADES